MPARNRSSKTPPTAPGSQQKADFRRRLRFPAALGVLCLCFGQMAVGGPRDQAYRIYNRLTGVPPTPQQLEQMTAMIEDGKVREAAYVAMDNHLFYSDTLKKMFAPWTNEAMSTTYARPNGTPGVILNDYSATLIGMVRDDLPFNRVLSHDYLYVGEGAEVPPDVPTYQVNNNDHYIQLEQRGINLKEALIQKRQVDLLPQIADREAEVGADGKPLVPAGVLTTRGFSEAYYDAGTNRAPFRFLLLTYFCEDNQAFHDTTVTTDRIRRDVERNALFVTKCQGCHAGMDGLTGAFAYLDWDATNRRMIYSRPMAGTTAAELSDEAGDYRCSNAETGNNPGPAQMAEFCVRPKYRSNLTQFTGGARTVDDSWVNYWNQGVNVKIGWPGAAGTMHRGNGPRSFGELMGNTKQFSSCMAKRVFKQVCFRDPLSSVDQGNIAGLAGKFEKGGYKMRSLFADAMSLCTGD